MDNATCERIARALAAELVDLADVPNSGRKSAIAYLASGGLVFTPDGVKLAEQGAMLHCGCPLDTVGLDTQQLQSITEGLIGLRSAGLVGDSKEVMEKGVLLRGGVLSLHAYGRLSPRAAVIFRGGWRLGPSVVFVAEEV